MCQLIFGKGAKIFQWAKKSLFNEFPESTGLPRAKERRRTALFYRPQKKSTSCWEGRGTQTREGAHSLLLTGSQVSSGMSAFHLPNCVAAVWPCLPRCQIHCLSQLLPPESKTCRCPSHFSMKSSAVIKCDAFAELSYLSTCFHGSRHLRAFSPLPFLLSI